MKSSAIDFFTIYDSVPIPGLVVDYAHEHKTVRYANKAFLENAQIELSAIASRKIHDLLKHLYLIDHKGEHVSLDASLEMVFNSKEELNLYILRTNETNGICRLEDNFNKVRISNLIFDDHDNSMCISLFFHKGGMISVQHTTNSALSKKLTCTIDSSGKIIAVDSLSLKTWGYSSEELLETQVSHLLPNDSRVYSWELFIEMLKKAHTISTDRTMYLKDQSIIPVNFTAVWDEEHHVLNAVVEDLRSKVETEFDFVMNEHRLKSLIKGGLDLIAIVDENAHFKYVSPNFSNDISLDLEEFIGKYAFEYLHPDDLEQYVLEFKQALDLSKVKSTPHRARNKEGVYQWYESVFTNLLSDPSIQGIVINTRNITDSYIAHRIEQLERDILEKNALPGSNLKDIATDYIKGIESIHEGMICSFLEQRDGHLYNISSPSLPLSYLKQIEGLKIGENIGSCGTAAFTKKTVIVTDIQNDARWVDHKSLVNPFNFRACWSIPIIDSNENVSATFSIYHKEVKEPSVNEHFIISRSSQFLRILIENYSRLEQIKRANERFRFATKATLSIIWDWDLKTDKMFWANDMLNFFGYSPADLSNDSHTWEKYIHPDDQKEVIESIRAELQGEGESWEKEYRFLKASGEYAIVLDRGFIIRDSNGTPQRMVGSMTDVTNVRNLKSLLENASRLAKMGSWEIDLVNSTVFYSKITREIHEFDDSFEPTVENGVNFYKEGYSREAIMNAMSHAIMKGLSWDIELEITTAKGNNRWVRAMGEPEFIDGNCVRLYGNLQDINDRKLAELKLQELNETLEKRAQQLVLSNDELQQFAYVSSHDLQEPLRMVTSFLTLLEKKYASQLDEKARQYIYFAVDGAQRMRHVILDLLEYSRVGSNEETLKKIDLKLLVEEILILHRKQIQEIDVQFTIESLPTIASFETPIRQVFQNLISNALKYHSLNEQPSITISSKETDAYYEFSIADNGIGIDPQYKDKVFQIFQRLHGKDKYSGTGVGLAICKKVMDALGGDIWLDTAYDKGAKFCFKIPKNTL